MASFQFTSPVVQLANANSLVYANSKIEFFLTGTDTASPVYQDAGLTTPHTNPVIADNAGLFPPIYLNQSIQYKALISDENDNVITTIDPVKVGYGVGLAAFDGLSPSGNKLPYFTGSTTAALTDLTAYGRSLLATASEAAFKALTNLEAGTDYPSQTTYDAHVAQALVDSDVGTTANKLVQLDGDAKLPAVDGSNLTNTPDTHVQPTALGAVGTYAFLGRSFTTSSQTVEPGETVAGSTLQYAGVDETGEIHLDSSPVVEGTWRCMGKLEIDTNNHKCATLFLRIS